MNKGSGKHDLFLRLFRPDGSVVDEIVIDAKAVAESFVQGNSRLYDAFSKANAHRASAQSANTLRFMSSDPRLGHGYYDAGVGIYYGFIPVTVLEEHAFSPHEHVASSSPMFSSARREGWKAVLYPQPHESPEIVNVTMPAQQNDVPAPDELLISDEEAADLAVALEECMEAGVRFARNMERTTARFSECLRDLSEAREIVAESNRRSSLALAGGHS